MKEKLKEFYETFLWVKFQVHIVQKVDDEKLGLLADMFSEKERFSFFQESFWGLNIFVELFFEALWDFIDNFHVTVTEFVDQSRKNCSPEFFEPRKTGEDVNGGLFDVGDCGC